MNSKTKVKFHIENMDPLGQGVSKQNEIVHFIAKVLPGERGKATQLRRKSKVGFASLDDPKDLDFASSDRIPSQCEHFNLCNGCHYWHTEYTNELKLKQLSLANLLTKMKVFSERPKIEVIAASERSNYRNRMQLHYDLNDKKLGLKKAYSSNIISIESCLIANQPIRKQIESLYSNESWVERIPKGQPRIGHIELYDSAGVISIAFNQHYAHKGFSQVNDEMNKKLVNLISTLINENPPHSNSDQVLDLFGGNGNLTQHILNREVIVVDKYPDELPLRAGSIFINCDLYDQTEVQSLQSRIKKKQFCTVLVDPPRSGFKGLGQILNNIDHTRFIYISCNPATLCRDLLELQLSHEISQVFLVDLFPATYHFETVVVLDRKTKMSSVTLPS